MSKAFKGVYLKELTPEGIIEVRKPDPQVRKRKTRNRGGKGKFYQFLANINGIGLAGLGGLNRLACKFQGEFRPKNEIFKPVDRGYNTKSSKEKRKKIIKVPIEYMDHVIHPLALTALDMIPLMNWHPDRYVAPVETEWPPKVLGSIKRDYSAFPPQKSKKGPKPNKKKIGATPRTKLFSTPEKYSPEPAEETPVIMRVRARA